MLSSDCHSAETKAFNRFIFQYKVVGFAGSSFAAVVPEIEQIAQREQRVGSVNAIIAQCAVFLDGVEPEAAVPSGAKPAGAHRHHVERQVSGFYAGNPQQAHKHLEVGSHAIVFAIKTEIGEHTSAAVHRRVRRSEAEAKLCAAEVLA